MTQTNETGKNERSPATVTIEKIPSRKKIALYIPRSAELKPTVDIDLVGSKWAMCYDLPYEEGVDIASFDLTDALKHTEDGWKQPHAGDFQIAVTAYKGEESVEYTPVPLTLTTEEMLAYGLVKHPSLDAGPLQNGLGEKLAAATERSDAAQGASEGTASESKADVPQGAKVDRRQTERSAGAAVTVPAPVIERLDMSNHINSRGLSLGIDVVDPTTVTHVLLTGSVQDSTGKVIEIARCRFATNGKRTHPFKVRNLLKQGVPFSEDQTILWIATSYDINNQPSQAATFEFALTPDNTRSLNYVQNARQQEQQDRVDRNREGERLSKLEDQLARLTERMNTSASKEEVSEIRRQIRETSSRIDGLRQQIGAEVREQIENGNKPILDLLGKLRDRPAGVSEDQVKSLITESRQTDKAADVAATKTVADQEKPQAEPVKQTEPAERQPWWAVWKRSGAGRQTPPPPSQEPVYNCPESPAPVIIRQDLTGQRDGNGTVMAFLAVVLAILIVYGIGMSPTFGMKQTVAVPVQGPPPTGESVTKAGSSDKKVSALDASHWQNGPRPESRVSDIPKSEAPKDSAKEMPKEAKQTEIASGDSGAYNRQQKPVVDKYGQRTYGPEKGRPVSEYYTDQKWHPVELPDTTPVAVIYDDYESNREIYPIRWGLRLSLGTDHDRHRRDRGFNKDQKTYIDRSLYGHHGNDMRHERTQPVSKPTWPTHRESAAPRPPAPRLDPRSGGYYVFNKSEPVDKVFSKSTPSGPSHSRGFRNPPKG